MQESTTPAAPGQPPPPRRSRIAIAAAAVAALAVAAWWHLATRPPPAAPLAGEPLEFADLAATRASEDEEITPLYPPALLALEGRRVVIRGFMAPFDSLTEMTRFMLMPYYVGCYFCAPPSLVQVLLVERPAPAPGEARPFVEEAIEVEGELRLYRPERDGDFDFARGFLFRLAGARFTPAGAAGPPRPLAHGRPANIPGGHGGENPGYDPAVGPVDEGRDELPGGEPVPPEEIAREVLRLRGREFTRPPAFAAVSPARIRELVVAAVEARLPAAEAEARAAAHLALGLAPQPFDFRMAAAAVAVQRAAGHYDPATNTIYYNVDLPLDQAAARVEFAKLVVAALQHQHLGSAPEPVPHGDDDEAWLMRQTVLRAEAARVGLLYARRQFSQPPPPETPFFFYADLGEPPPGLDGILSAPYLLGSYLADDVFATGGWPDLEALHARPPGSSAELLDARAWNQEARFTPARIDWPDASFDSAAPLHSNTLGQAGLRVWVSLWHDMDAAREATAGWRGDRYAVWPQTGASPPALLETRWADEAAARRFFEVLAEWPRSLLRVEPGLSADGLTLTAAGPAQAIHAELNPAKAGVRVAVAPDAAAAARLAAAVRPGG
jgi:hypothetical protein